MVMTRNKMSKTFFQSRDIVHLIKLASSIVLIIFSFQIIEKNKTKNRTLNIWNC